MRVNSLFMLKRLVKTILFFVLLGLSFESIAQVQQFSRQDSAVLLNATEKYNRSLKKKHFKEVANNLNEIAFLYWDHNHYKKAITYYEKSLIYNKKIANENGIAMISNNLGMLYDDIEDYEKSLSYFNVTLATRRSNNEKIGIISALINLSVVKNNLKLYDYAITDLEEATTLAREMNDLDQMKSCYGMLAETYQKAGNIEKSLYYFEFYRTFQELSQKTKVNNIEEALAIERSQKAALETEHITIQSQLISKKGEVSAMSKKIADVDSTLSNLNIALDSKNMELDLIQKEKEILRLKAESEIEKGIEESRKRKNTLILSALIIGFLLLLTIVILISRRNINTKNKLLVKSNQELEDANRVKNILFSIIGHDLKSPLAQLESTFMLLDNDLLDKKETDFIFGELKNGLKEANILLDNLLAWAKNQIHGERLTLTNFELNEVVEESLFVLGNLHRSKDLQLIKEFNFIGGLEADQDMVKLIVRNLTSNAIKFTPTGNEITIKTFKEGEFAGIKVADNGVGMSQDQITALFDASTNTSTYGTEREKGTGIGLKLCKNFIDLMQGKIEVASEKGQGTSFTVLLPINGK